MAVPTGNLKHFIVWEKKARNAIDHRYPVKSVIAEARVAWGQNTSRQRYAAVLREVVKESTKARLCDKAICTVPKRFTRRSRTPPAQAYCDRWITLREARRAWRVVRDELLKLEIEQRERHGGNVIANARTLAHTALLLRETTDRIAQLERDLRECDAGRSRYGVPVSPNSEYSESDSDDFVTIDEDSEDSSEESGSSNEEPVSSGEESQSNDEESQSSDAESQSNDDDDGPPQESGIILKLYRRKRKSGDRSEGTNSKRSRTDSGAEKSAERRRGSSAKGVVSSDEDNGEEDEEEAGEDGGAGQNGNAVMGKKKEEEEEEEEEDEEESDSDGSTNYLVMSLDDFDALWNQLDELAQQNGQVIDGWDENYARVRRRARRLLKSEDWAIVPEIEDDMDVEAALDDLEVEVEMAKGKQDERREVRKAMRENELAGTKELGFGKAKHRSRIPGNFVFESKIGEGHFATASLWVRKDSNENIVDRIAIKDIYCKDTQWNHALSFIGDIQDRTSREAHMHQLASAKDPEALCVVKYRESAVFRAHKLIRIYMEYCALGEFKEVWLKHWNSTQKTSYPLVSTAALWAIFECYAKAIHIMSFGCLPNEDEPEGWDPIVHRDIKSENVLMSPPHKSRWKGTPTMKLADFGFAAFVSERRLLDGLVGTHGYISPEITDYTKRPPDCMVSSAADVFTLGMVMADLLTSAVDADTSFDFGVEDDKYPKIDRGPAKEHYPDVLLELIHSCVRKWPQDRIGVKELCRRIEEEVRDLRQAELSEEENARFPWHNQVHASMARRP